MHDWSRGVITREPTSLTTKIYRVGSRGLARRLGRIIEVIITILTLIVLIVLTLVRYAIIIMLILAIVGVALELTIGKNPIEKLLEEVEYHPSVDEEEVKRAVLEEINKEREKSGIPPVELIELGIAEYRANDMLANNYYGHCDLEGRHPGYYYTILNGLYAMEENVGLTYISLGDDPAEKARELVRAMIYDDAHANWGHRDSLLDPTNNKVDIGVAYGEGWLYIVIHMQKAWVEWTIPPIYDPETGIFRAKGELLLNASKLDSVIIYWSDYDTRLITGDPGCGTRFNCTCDSYDIGESVAGVVESSLYYYEEIDTIIAKEWSVSGRTFSISFKWKPEKPGLYTIVLWAKNTLPYTHPYDKDRYKYYLPILEYTFEYEG